MHLVKIEEAVVLCVSVLFRRFTWLPSARISSSVLKALRISRAFLAAPKRRSTFGGNGLLYFIQDASEEVLAATPVADDITEPAGK